MADKPATFDPLRAYELSHEALDGVTLTLKRKPDGETRTVTLAEALRGVDEGGWAYDGGPFGIRPTVTINGAVSEVDGPLLGTGLLRAFAKTDEDGRSALWHGAWFHVDRIGFPEDPIDQHGFFVTSERDVRVELQVADAWGVSDAPRITDLIKPLDYGDLSDRYALARALLARQRFETETEIGRLVAIDRRICDLEDLGARPSVDALNLQREIMAGRRAHELARHLRRITWLLIALLALAAWVAWRVA
jgi:hypothetical protein